MSPVIHKHIEEYCLNAWPALQTFVYDGWLLRFADGYTKRSNSVSPMYSGVETDINRKIEYCESVYSHTGLETIFKITPFVAPEQLDTILEQKGYVVVEPSSVRVLDLSDVEQPAPAEIVISEEMTAEWLAVIARFNRLSAAQIRVTERLLAPSGLRRGFFTLKIDSLPVACGLGVIENGFVGLYDIVTDENYRNRGYGKQLILHIIQWAKMHGADRGYLLVVQSNKPAIALYDKLGYREIYTYWYRVKKKSGGGFA